MVEAEHHAELVLPLLGDMSEGEVQEKEKKGKETFCRCNHNISKIALVAMLLAIVAMGVFFVFFEGCELDTVPLMFESDSLAMNEEFQLNNRDLHSPNLLKADSLPSTAFVLTTENFEKWRLENEFVFINFYAPWCVWSQRLAPTWETLSREIQRQGIPMAIGKVDCEAHPSLCRQEDIRAFPTLRWFSKGEAVLPDFNMDRTLESLTLASRRKVEVLRLSLTPKDTTKRNTLATAEEDKLDQHFVSASYLFGDNFNAWIDANDVALIHFFATSWSTRSKKLASTWDEFANEAHKSSHPMAIGKVDCATQEELCQREQIVTYPTFRWYIKGQAMLPGFSTDLMTDESVEGFQMVAGQMLQLLETFHLASEKPAIGHFIMGSPDSDQASYEEEEEEDVSSYNYPWGSEIYRDAEPQVDAEVESILKSPINWQTSVSFDEASEEYIVLNEEFESAWDFPLDDDDDYFFASGFYFSVHDEENEAASSDEISFESVSSVTKEKL